MIGIYKFTNKLNGKVYIGQSIDIKKRYKAHLDISKKKKDKRTYFHNALREYGIENFDFEILIECPKENLNYWEKYYIKYYNSNSKQFGYNETDGGYSTSFSEDTLKRMSESAKKRGYVKSQDWHPSEESKKKMSESAKRRGYNRIDWHPSEEQRKRHSEFMKGRIDSEETLYKKSESMKGKNKGKHRVYREDGTYYMTR